MACHICAGFWCADWIGLHQQTDLTLLLRLFRHLLFQWLYFLISKPELCVQAPGSVLKPLVQCHQCRFPGLNERRNAFWRQSSVLPRCGLHPEGTLHCGLTAFWKPRVACLFLSVVPCGSEEGLVQTRVLGVLPSSALSSPHWCFCQPSDAECNGTGDT